MTDPFDRDPDEIFEPDSEAGDQSIPAVEGPTSEAPTAPDPTAGLPDPAENYDDADPELRKAFWKLVLLYKIGLVATSLGAMLVVFRGSTWGIRVFAGGAVVLGYALYRTRTTRRRIEREEFEGDVDRVKNDRDVDEEKTEHETSTEQDSPTGDEQ